MWFKVGFFSAIQLNRPDPSGLGRTPVEKFSNPGSVRQVSNRTLTVCQNLSCSTRLPIVIALAFQRCRRVGYCQRSGAPHRPGTVWQTSKGCRPRSPFRTVSVLPPSASVQKTPKTPRQERETGWMLLDRQFVPEEGMRCRPGPLVGVIASDFQRCNMPVHKDNILAGFGQTRVRIVVVK